MISTSFWDEDEYIATLSSDEILVFLHLLTNPKVSLCGIYKLLLRDAVAQTKLEKEVILKCYKKFQDEKRIFCKDSWIILLNRMKYQKNPSPKITRGIERELNEIPQEVKDLAYGIDNASIGSRKPKVKSKAKSKVGLLEKEFDKKSEEYRLSKLLFDLILKNNPTHRFSKLNDEDKDIQIQLYAADTDAILRIDQRDLEHFEFLIHWSQQSQFWKQNILSMGKLREQFDTLTIQAKVDFEKRNAEKSKNKIL